MYRSVSGFIAGAIILARSDKIWPDHDENSPDLNEISLDLIKSGPDLDEISLYFVQSDGFQVNFRRRTLVFVCFHQRTPNIARSFWLYARVRLLGFWERKPANRPTDVEFCGQRPATDYRSGRFRRFLIWVRVGFSG